VSHPKRFFVNLSIEIDKNYKFNKENLDHLKKVLRLKTDQELTVVSKINSKAYLVKLTSDNGDFLVISKIENEIKLSKLTTIIQPLLNKASKNELIIEKLTELGISNILFFKSDRNQIKINFDVNKRIVRFNKIAENASKQCKRNTIPQIKIFDSLKSLFEEQIENFTNLQKIQAKINQDLPKLSSIIREKESYLLLCGSEGGVSETEQNIINKHSFTQFKLGDLILRAETASISAASVITFI